MANINFKDARKAFEDALADVIQQGREDKIDLGAVNYGDIRVSDVQQVRSEDGRVFWRIIVEECSPDCNIPKYMFPRLPEILRNTEITCEW
jgi:hypothetical protein